MIYLLLYLICINCFTEINIFLSRVCKLVFFILRLLVFIGDFLFQICIINLIFHVLYRKCFGNKIHQLQKHTSKAANVASDRIILYLYNCLTVSEFFEAKIYYYIVGSITGSVFEYIAVRDTKKILLKDINSSWHYLLRIYPLFFKYTSW